MRRNGGKTAVASTGYTRGGRNGDNTEGGSRGYTNKGDSGGRNGDKTEGGIGGYPNKGAQRRGATGTIQMEEAEAVPDTWGRGATRQRAEAEGSRVYTRAGATEV